LQKESHGEEKKAGLKTGWRALKPPGKEEVGKPRGGRVLMDTSSAWSNEGIE